MSLKIQLISFTVYCPCVTTVSDDRRNNFLFQSVSLRKQILKFIFFPCALLLQVSCRQVPGQRHFINVSTDGKDAEGVEASYVPENSHAGSLQESGSHNALFFQCVHQTQNFEGKELISRPSNVFLGGGVCAITCSED